MNDKQRAEFEKWASQYEYDLTWSSAIDCYAIMRTRVVFDAWQAAIASVVVELPPRLRGIDEHCRINNRAVDLMQQKLTEAGIRYE